MVEARPLSSKNPRLKHLRRLVRDGKVRSEERAFVAEGPVLVAEALRAPHVEVREVFVDVDLDPAFLAELTQAGAEPTAVAAGVLASVLDTVHPRPVAAVVVCPSSALDDLPLAQPVLVLVDVRDPGNVGTLMRTAEAAGFGGVILAGTCADSTNPKVVRAAAGARFRLPVVVAPDSQSTLHSLADVRPVLATVVADSATAPNLPSDPPGASSRIGDYTEADLTHAAIVLGNEAHGLDDASVSAASAAITIPLAGPTESLNVAAAGAVLCFESLRQRRRIGPDVAPDAANSEIK